MRKIIKKINSILFDKDVWISTLISSVCTSVFIFVGGYVAFVTSIQPWWYKLIFVAVLALVLYILCGVIERTVFKRLGRKPPE